MRRSERRDDLMWWGTMGLVVGLLAGFALAEVVKGLAGPVRLGSEDRIPGEQEGASVEDGLTHAELSLADQSA